MLPITYLKGDATSPQAAGVKVVAHCCNDLGRWGKGFVLAVSARWPAAETAYKDWYRGGAADGFGLGAVQFIPVESHVWVANIVGQKGIKRGSSGPPVRYDALARCLDQLGTRAAELGASVHMPRIGCGLAGGDWSRVGPLVEEHVAARGVAVTVYDFG